MIFHADDESIRVEILTSSTEAPPADSCEINNGGCADQCLPLLDGHLCTCQSAGFRLARDQLSCVDVDECDLDTDTCNDDSQHCINTIGSFYCIAKSFGLTGT